MYTAGTRRLIVIIAVSSVPTITFARAETIAVRKVDEPATTNITVLIAVRVTRTYFSVRAVANARIVPRSAPYVTCARAVPLTRVLTATYVTNAPRKCAVTAICAVIVHSTFAPCAANVMNVPRNTALDAVSAANAPTFAVSVARASIVPAVFVATVTLVPNVRSYVITATAAKCARLSARIADFATNVKRANTAGVKTVTGAESV